MIIDSQMTELGYSLKSYRVRNNITQQELAERLGVSTNTIHLCMGNKSMQTVNGLTADSI